MKSIADNLCEEMGLGTVIPSFTGTTTTLTLTTTGASELRGPFTGAKIAIGSPILITAGGTPGEDTFVKQWVPSTGVITVEPAITTGATDAIIFDAEQIKHADRVLEAINRALQNRVRRWQLMPLTYVPDGDLQGVTVADYWTAAANGTAAYAAAQTYPAGSAADAAGQVGLNRVVQLTTSGGASTLTGNGIRVPLTNQQRSWYFLTAIRLVSGAGTAELKIRDNTNAADIALQVSRGNDTNTLTMTTFGDFMVCEGTFQVPATCAEIAPQLSLSATGQVAQLAPFIMYPQDAMSFPLPNRIQSTEHVGNFHYAHQGSSPGAIGGMGFSEPITTEGRTHTFSNYGDHLTVTFNFRPNRPVYYDELIRGAALAGVTETTTFPLNQVLKHAEYELRKRLARDAQQKVRGPETKIYADEMRRMAREAERAARWSEYEPELMHIVGRG